MLSSFANRSYAPRTISHTYRRGRVFPSLNHSIMAEMKATSMVYRGLEESEVASMGRWGPV
jgi:hypothetical protein